VLIAHLLTGTRALLVVPFAWWMLRDDTTARLVAAGLIVLAIVTDLLDGLAARRAGGGTAAGRAFDHTADFAFVSAGLFALAWRGAGPLWLPILVVVAFAQYVVDSYWLHAERELRMSRLGRWNGILYFVPLCVDVASRMAGDLLAQPVRWLCWVLVAMTVASIADRALALRSDRRVRDSRGAGTTDPPPH
jgi:phosphatidylglycerophosphate synthase